MKTTMLAVIALVLLNSALTGQMGRRLYAHRPKNSDKDTLPWPAGGAVKARDAAVDWLRQR